MLILPADFLLVLHIGLSHILVIWIHISISLVLINELFSSFSKELVDKFYFSFSWQNEHSLSPRTGSEKLTLAFLLTDFHNIGGNAVKKWMLHLLTFV